MAAVFLGAVPEELDALAIDLGAHAERLRSLAAQVSGQLRATTWHGPDLDTFNQQWFGTFSPQVSGAAQALNDAATTLRGQAVQQRVASAPVAGAAGVVGVVGAGGVAGGVGAVGQNGGAGGGQQGPWGGLWNTAQGGWKVFSDLTRATTLYKAITTAEEMHWTNFLWGSSDLPAFAESLLTKVGVSDSALGWLGAAKGVAGKVALPLVVFSGVKDLITGAGDPGWHGALSRTMGGVGALGATTLLAGSFGGSTMAAFAGLSFALPEVVVPIAAAAVVIYGAYQAGNYIYDHRQAIGHALTTVWNGAGHLISSGAGAVADSVTSTVNTVKDTWHAVTHPGSIIHSIFG